MRIKLLELPEHKELIGQIINVQSQGGEFHYDYQDQKVFRQFEGARIAKENNEKWLRWFWVPAEPHYLPQDTFKTQPIYDCGWSGIKITNNPFIDTYFLETE